MAIEMMMLKLQKHEDRRGYTNAVDWWSLGVTIFVLLTGLKPFPQLNSASVASIAKAIQQNPQYKEGTKKLLEKNPDFQNMPVEYTYIYDKLCSVGTVSQITMNIILLLLDFNEHTRLGSKGGGGLEVLKQHSFFKWEVAELDTGSGGAPSGVYQMSRKPSAGNTNLPSDKAVSSNSVSNPEPDILAVGGAVDGTAYRESDATPVAPSTPVETKHVEYCWDYLEQKQIVPPFSPEVPEINETANYANFDEMMMGLDKVSWLKQYPSTYYDEYFQNW